MWNCVVLVSSVKVREAPNTANISTLKMLEGEHFQVSEIVPDSTAPDNPAKKWGRIFGGEFAGKYTALEYPGNASPISSYVSDTDVPPPPPPPPPSSTKKYVATLLDDETGELWAGTLSKQ